MRTAKQRKLSASSLWMNGAIIFCVQQKTQTISKCIQQKNNSINRNRIPFRSVLMWNKTFFKEEVCAFLSIYRRPPRNENSLTDGVQNSIMFFCGEIPDGRKSRTARSCKRNLADTLWVMHIAHTTKCWHKQFKRSVFALHICAAHSRRPQWKYKNNSSSTSSLRCIIIVCVCVCVHFPAPIGNWNPGKRNARANSCSHQTAEGFIFSPFFRIIHRV